ncbi:MAG: alanine racemase [Oscillospiraceae bacterium]|nr:alanine racemase [Oscillospiraceae bacterium]
MFSESFNKRTWAEINLSALRANVGEIRRLAPNKEIIAVVKANAYGHGDNIICPELKKTEVNFFAVSCIEEALHIKEYVGDSQILIFGFTEKEYLQKVVENNFILTVGDIDYARELNSSAVKLPSAVRRKIRAHIKLNTGMNRVGINTEGELEEILSLTELKCEAVYTHFSCADSLNAEDLLFTRKQQEKLLCAAKGRGLKIHSQNSGGILFHSDFEADYVRAGLILYGYSPNISCPSLPVKLSPVMSFKSVIRQLRTLETGDFVSYGRTYKADKKRLAAVIPAGYADGYSRLHSNSGLAIVKNTLCPVLGRVCMDSLIIDVSHVEEIKVGDEVLLYSDKFKETSVEYIAEKLGTIPYEITCAVGNRVKRVAIDI